MKHLIIYCHPNSKSFCNSILKELEFELETVCAETKVRDLYALGFNPVLSTTDLEQLNSGKVLEDVQVEQEFIVWADEITFIYPIWWTGMPAILKGYIDRVFSYGFAYKSNFEGLEGLLINKKINIVNTMEAREEFYRGSGMIYSMKQTTDEGIFEMCGMEVKNHLFFGAVNSIDDKTRANMLSQIGDLVGLPHAMWY